MVREVCVRSLGFLCGGSFILIRVCTYKKNIFIDTKGVAWA